MIRAAQRQVDSLTGMTLRSLRPHMAVPFGLLLTASVFLMALTPVRDPDSWMHLSLGRFLWELKGFPETEPFAYPSAGNDFFYTSWLFAVITYLINAVLGSAGLVLLRASILSGTFLILFWDAVRGRGSPALATIVFTAVIFVAQSRFVVRPEIFFLIFLCFSVFALNAYRYESKRYLFALPLVHFLWANCHSSIIQMVVPFGAFIVGGVLQRPLARFGIGEEHAPSLTEVKTVTAVFILSALVSLLNPNGIDQYLYGYKILSSDWIAQEIIELRRPEGNELVVVVLTGAMVLTSFLLNWRQLSLPHLLLFLPFLGLGYTSNRFVALPAIVGGPLLVRNLASFLRGRGLDSPLQSTFANAVAAFWVIGFTILSVANVSPFGIHGGTLGLGSDISQMPAGAIAYMNRHGITGRVFNTFHFGQYVIWTGYPNRTVFIDGRANIPSDLLEMNKKIRSAPGTLDELHQQFRFESLLLGYLTERPRTGGLEGTLDLSFSHPDWALVYWDDISMLYLRRGGPYREIVSEDAYNYVRPQVSLAFFMNQLSQHDRLAPLAAELERARRETGSVRSTLLLGLTYQTEGKHLEGIRLMKMSQPDLPQEDRQFSLMALGDSYKAVGRTEAALAHYREALALGESSRIHIRIARMMLDLGRADVAITELSRALEIDRSAMEAFPLLAHAYQQLGDVGKAADMEALAQNFGAVDAGKIHFENGVRAYFQKDYEHAVQEYLKSLAVNPSIPIVHVNLGHAYLDWGKAAEGRAAFENALRLEPDHAKAHYGLALALKSLGHTQLAREHFSRYLKLEPEGNLARSAKREMERLPEQ